MAEGVERMSKKRENREEATADRYLRGLSARWEDFQGKKVLDVGVLEGEFADAARRRGIDVTSIDMRRRDWNRAHRSPTSREGAKFVQGNAEMMPFAEGSFDALISHAGPFGSGDKDLFMEAYRVLKPGGTLRLGPTPILPEGPAEGLPEDGPERYAAIRQRSKEFMGKLAKEIGFSDAQYYEHPPNEEGIATCSFVLTK